MDYAQQVAMPAQNPSNKIQIFISCRKLKDLDVMSKSDPVCHVFLRDQKSNNYQLIGTTETLENNLNPDFTTNFTVDYYFEKEQYLKFSIYDADVTTNEHIGDCEFTISKLMTSQKQTVINDLTLPGKNKSRGKIVVRADSVQQSNDEIVMKMSARLTSKAGLCCGSDNPYVLIQRARSNDEVSASEKDFIRVFETHRVQGSCPSWKQIKTKMQIICNSDKTVPVKFQVYNYKDSTPPQLYGEFSTTMAELNENPKKVYTLKNEKRANQGTLTFDQFQIIEKPSFVEYLRSGWFINLAAAIDFTASNGEVFEKNSLHRQYPDGQLNQYEQALQYVGTILQDYAYENKFAAFGFGGVPRFVGATSVSHCFNLTGGPDPTVQGLQNLFGAYKAAIQSVSLSGPTYFSHILKVVLEYMKSNLQLPMYHILLILTDGAIHDMRDTKNLIVECSQYPISIIIVGVGDANFSNMVELDGDNEILRNQSGQAAVRDIVQFVEFNEFKNKGINLLAEEVLREVPDQLVSYMLMKGIKPNPPPLMSLNTINNQF